MKWEKLGLVYSPPGYGWRTSHAYLPTAVNYKEYIRVFCSFWDSKKVGRIGYVDVSVKDPTKILKVSETPVMDIRKQGNFDCNGVTPISFLQDDDFLIMFYTGWGVSDKYPYTLFTGIAASDNGGESFSRIYPTPILGPTPQEDSIRTAATICETNIEERCYWLYYVGGNGWKNVNGKLTPMYDLRLIKSNHPLIWGGQPSHLVMAADHKNGEYAIGRPQFWTDNNTIKMIYSSRQYNGGYRLSYAESKDGIIWEIKPELVGISLSDEGWDSQMQCFSSIISTEHGIYMFYNGNNHGYQGFGVARLVEK